MSSPSQVPKRTRPVTLSDFPPELKIRVGELCAGQDARFNEWSAATLHCYAQQLYPRIVARSLVLHVARIDARLVKDGRLWYSDWLTPSPTACIRTLTLDTAEDGGEDDALIGLALANLRTLRIKPWFFYFFRLYRERALFTAFANPSDSPGQVTIALSAALKRIQHLDLSFRSASAIQECLCAAGALRSLTLTSSFQPGQADELLHAIKLVPSLEELRLRAPTEYLEFDLEVVGSTIPGRIPDLRSLILEGDASFPADHTFPHLDAVELFGPRSVVLPLIKPATPLTFPSLRCLLISSDLEPTRPTAAPLLTLQRFVDAAPHPFARLQLYPLVGVGTLRTRTFLATWCAERGIAFFGLPLARFPDPFLLSSPEAQRAALDADDAGGAELAAARAAIVRAKAHLDGLYDAAMRQGEASSELRRLANVLREAELDRVVMEG
ncbi:hypothetical protein JCM10450v2_008221 [Rhodotorula kratochvilovae]